MQQTAVAVTSGSGHFRTKCAAAKQGVANLHIPLTPDPNYDPPPEGIDHGSASQR
jgi:hypothetical protein